CQQYDTDPYNF
nr:immunoglobulin light chain junction region [Macaca mulatta]